MTEIKITATSLSEYFAELRQHLDLRIESAGAEAIATMASPTGFGCMRSISLGSGLALTSTEFQFYDEVRMEVEVQWKSFALEICLAGNVRWQMSGLREEQETSPGQILLSGSQAGHYGWMGFPTRQKSQVLGIQAAPHDFVRLIGHDFSDVADRMQEFDENSAHQPYFRFSRVTPEILTAARQILNCRYEGVVRQLYLESKALELIALQLALLTSQPQPRSQNGNGRLRLRPDDIERLHQARELLIASYENPPTLAQLARQTGLNEFKLKNGFQQLFGTTVYGCLRDYRMELARDLLSERKMNVAEVAMAVGYANASHFAAAYKRRFGILPKIHFRP